MSKIDEYRSSLKAQLLAKRGMLLEAQETVKQVERDTLRIEGALMKIDEILAIHSLDQDAQQKAAKKKKTGEGGQ